MTPENLRNLSWRAFKTTIYCGVAVAILLVALPNPGFGGSASLAARALAMTAFGLGAVAIIANLVSLVSGVLAWTRGAGRCYWIFFCGILLLVPAILSLALWLEW